jgi:hypothetical protein
MGSGFGGVPEKVTLPVMDPLPGPAIAGTDIIASAAMHSFSNRISDPTSSLTLEILCKLAWMKLFALFRARNGCPSGVRADVELPLE